MPTRRNTRPSRRWPRPAGALLALGLLLALAMPLVAAPLPPATGPPAVPAQAGGCDPTNPITPSPAPPWAPAPPVTPAPGDADPANPLAQAAQQVVGGFLLDLLMPVPALIRQHLDSQFNILTRTCRQHTVDLRQVRDVWAISRGIALAALGLIVTWAGYRVIFRPLGFGADDAGQLLARVAVGALAAWSSGEWLGLFIDLNNALIAELPPADFAALLTQFDGLMPANPLVPGGPDLFRLALLAVLAVALLLFVLTAVVRLATLNLLIALCPIFIILWVHRQTESWAAWWWRLFLGALLCQPVQLLAIHLGALMAAGAGGTEAPLLASLASIATVLTALSVPVLIGAPFAGQSVSGATSRALATAVTVRRVIDR